MPRFTVRAKLASNPNQTVIEDSPVRTKLASNPNPAAIGAGDPYA